MNRQKHRLLLHLLDQALPGGLGLVETAVGLLQLELGRVRGVREAGEHQQVDNGGNGPRDAEDPVRADVVAARHGSLPREDADDR